MFHAPVSSWIDVLPSWEFTAWQIYLERVGLPRERENYQSAHAAMHSILPWVAKNVKPKVKDFLPFNDPWVTEIPTMSGQEMWDRMKKAKAQNNAAMAAKMRDKEGWH